MEKGDLYDGGPNSAVIESYRRWRGLETTKREIELAIKKLEMSGCRTLAEREELVRLRRFQAQDQGLEPVRPLRSSWRG